MAEENDTLKLTSVNYTSDNYLAAKKNEDGSYNVAGKVVFNEDITVSGGEVATKADLDGKQDNVGLFIDDGGNVSVGTGIKQYGMTSINYFEGLTQFEAGAEINNNAKINGQIIQSGMPYENYFEGLTRFGGSVEFQGDIKIGDQHPVLNLYSSDNSVTVTRDLDGYGFDLKANSGGGEVKSDTWYCKCLTQDMNVGFNDSSITTIPGVTAAWTWGESETSPGRNAKIVFEKQLSITEVNNALCHFEMWSGPIFRADVYYAFAMCPMDDELEAMIPSYAEKIK